MCKFITSNNTSIDYSLALSGSHGHQSMKSDISISKFQKLRPRVKMAGWFKSYANVELLCPIMLRERFRKMSCLKIQRKYYNREMSCLNCQQNLLAPSIVRAIPFWDFLSSNEFWINESIHLISSTILHDWNSHSNFISSLQDLQE